MVATRFRMGRFCPTAPGSKSTCETRKSRKTIGTWMLLPSGGRAHVYPASGWHVAEQPSPDRLLPSSHASPSSTPSPHRLVQAPLVHVGSLWQSDEQPSNGIVLPSSQPSSPSRTLSPQ